VNQGGEGPVDDKQMKFRYAGTWGDHVTGCQTASGRHGLGCGIRHGLDSRAHARVLDDVEGGSTSRLGASMRRPVSVTGPSPRRPPPSHRLRLMNRKHYSPTVTHVKEQLGLTD
jgi:hypothetical protein